MMKLFKILLVLLALVTFAYLNKIQLKKLWVKINDIYFPCTIPISYSLGTFDTRFGISKTDFLGAISQAEAIWEKSINKNLFEYKEADADVKVNLIYDLRKEATVSLGKIGTLVQNDRATYDSLKSQYQSLQIQYEQNKSLHESLVANFERKKSAYDREVSIWNQKGGAPQKEYARLTEEGKALDSDFAKIKKLEEEIKVQVDEINKLVPMLNRIASSLNLNISEYNEVGQARGEEFEEGLYKSGADRQEIVIYQFDTKNRLIRVLAHELGHAMDIDHVKDPKAIMYAFNQGTNLALAPDDLTALKNHCGLK